MHIPNFALSDRSPAATTNSVNKASKSTKKVDFVHVVIITSLLVVCTELRIEWENNISFLPPPVKYG